MAATPWSQDRAGWRRSGFSSSKANWRAISRRRAPSSKPALSAEASLAENVQRVAMNAMDEMEAFARLVDDGMSVEAIAERFGASVRHVEQRLALGRLSPKIRAAYRKGDLTLDVARAFCLTDDHGAQERLFKQVPEADHPCAQHPQRAVRRARACHRPAGALRWTGGL
jgi:hypothetical protein